MRLLATPPALATMKRDLDELVDRFVTPFELGFGAPGPEPSLVFTPACDLVETATDFVLRLDVPAIPTEKLELNLEANLLTIAGVVERPVLPPGGTLLVAERPVGKFFRAIRLPKPVVPTDVAATLVNGVLTVRLAKAPAAVANRIAIAG